MKRNHVKAIAVIEAAAVVILLIFAVVTYSFAEKRGLRGESVSPDGVYCAEIYNYGNHLSVARECIECEVVLKNTDNGKKELCTLGFEARDGLCDISWGEKSCELIYTDKDGNKKTIVLPFEKALGGDAE